MSCSGFEYFLNLSAHVIFKNVESRFAFNNLLLNFYTSNDK